MTYCCCCRWGREVLSVGGGKRRRGRRGGVRDSREEEERDGERELGFNLHRARGRVLLIGHSKEVIVENPLAA